MNPESKQKVEEIRKVLANIRAHKSYTARLNNLLENITFFILDFEYEEFDHVQDWLKVYDIQAHQKIYPVQLYPPIHPDYLILKDNPFEKEFEIIKNFFEFVRKETQKVGG